MSEKESLHGLTCPNCGGVVPIPEGQVIVRCPYCDLRSFVRGERGLRRYQVPQRVERQGAVDALRRFFSSNWAIARNAGRQSRLIEAFMVHLPFWAVWGRVAGWAFGQERVGSGDSAHYEPRELRIVQEMTWNGAACDVGEFGVNQVPLADQSLEPFDPEALHASGMVFEPVGSFSDASAAAEEKFQAQVRQKAKLDRLAQLFVRSFHRRYGLVYYPVWVMRYLYRGRAFQVVVDGYSGNVLYGKAPGNTLYRAAVLVLGMAVGAFLALDVSAFFLPQASGHDGEGALAVALVAFLAGLALMGLAYRKFRYGEQFEYRSGGSDFSVGPGSPLESISAELGSMDLGPVKIRDVEKWLNQLN